MNSVIWSIGRKVGIKSDACHLIKKKCKNRWSITWIWEKVVKSKLQEWNWLKSCNRSQKRETKEGEQRKPKKMKIFRERERERVAATGRREGKSCKLNQWSLKLGFNWFPWKWIQFSLVLMQMDWVSFYTKWTGLFRLVHQIL